MVIKRGDIYYAELSPVMGAEIGGLRPVVVISNDQINRFASTVVVAAITSKKITLNSSCVILFSTENIGLVKDCAILLDQIRTLDKRRLKEKMGHIDDEKMKRVDRALQVSLNLQNT